MEIRYCSFCGAKLEPGTGKMFVRRDGSSLYFDTSKCERNYLKLKREPRDVLWTEEGREGRRQRATGAKGGKKKSKKARLKKIKEEKKETVEPVKEGS
ncbi:MAG: 50S ribosomal protein L24e [Candidatus Thermoplasmatota archaeon]|nr:50S ribosomal protein L24e [Candidatus Thermoplasmatota archaeon]